MIVFGVLVLVAWACMAVGFASAPDNTIRGWAFTVPCIFLLVGSVVLAVHAL